MSNSNNVYEASDSLHVNRAKVDSITIYDVTESELVEIESCSPVDWLFNLAIACITTTISFTVTLTTTRIENERLFYSYVILTSISALSAIGLFFNWKILKGKRDDVIVRIKARKKETEMQTDGDPTVAGPSGERAGN